MRKAPAPGRQRGISMVLFAVGGAAVIAVVGLAIDLGGAYLARTRLQNALDAAAYSAAVVLHDTWSATLATAEASSAFATNLPGSGLTLTVETSPTLSPFTPGGGGTQQFVRVSAGPMSAGNAFATAITVSGRSLAGPIPLGGEICGAVPIVLCGSGTDTDCSDYSCFGLGTGPGQEVVVTGHNTTLGSGNYGFVEATCGTGAACLRSGLAGGEDLCFTEGGTVETEPGINAGPASQGFNTRFGIYAGPVSATNYPPDHVTTYPLTYAQYQTRSADSSQWNYGSTGRPQRRVVTVPVVDCTSVNGSTTTTTLGAVCLFATRPMDGTGQGEIRGELVPTCTAEGGVPEVPEPGGPEKVVLYGSDT